MRYPTVGSDSLSARKVSVLSLGAMRFGTTTDEATSFAILDRYVAAGGTFIDSVLAGYRWNGVVMVGNEAAWPSLGRPSSCSAVPSRE